MFPVLKIIFGLKHLKCLSVCTLCFSSLSVLHTAKFSFVCWHWFSEFPALGRSHTFVTSNMASGVQNLHHACPTGEPWACPAFLIVQSQTVLCQSRFACRTKLPDADMIIKTKATNRKVSHWVWNVCQICSKYHLCHLRVQCQSCIPYPCSGELVLT